MTENLNLGGGKDGHVEVWEVEAVAEHSTRTGHRARQPGRGNSSKEQRVAGGVLAKVSIREEGGGGEEDGEVLLVVGERYSAAGKRGGGVGFHLVSRSGIFCRVEQERRNRDEKVRRQQECRRW